MPERHIVHRLPDEMKSQAARTDFFEFAPSQLGGVDSHSFIDEADFKSVLHPFRLFPMSSIEGHFDRPIKLPQVGMTNDVCHRLIDSQNKRPPLFRWKSQCRREFAHRCANDAKRLWIAEQIQLQYQLVFLQCSKTIEFSLPGSLWVTRR